MLLQMHGKGMAAPKRSYPTRNSLLASLSPSEREELQPDFEPVDLPLRFVLEEPDAPIKHAYFPDSGIASVVGNGRGVKRRLEIGIIGREGMTGLAILAGNHRTPNRTYMQVAGAGQRIAAEKLRHAMRQSPSLHFRLLRFFQAFLIQIAQTAISNAQAPLAERVARWVLMAHDRIDSDDLPLTHEFLSIMLGVRRPGVTVALQQLEKEALIRLSRGHVTILSRPDLIKMAGESYGVAESELRRLTGRSPDKSGRPEASSGDGAQRRRSGE